jgi:hypothetical protein
MRSTTTLPVAGLSGLKVWGLFCFFWGGGERGGLSKTGRRWEL